MPYYRGMTAVVLGLAISAGLACQGSSVSETASDADSKPRSRVTRLDITSRRPAFDNHSFGQVGPYEILMGTATAVADPQAVENSGIVDLDGAPRNDEGLVEYRFDVHILKPVDIFKGNDTLVYEVNNRGRGIVYGYFNGGGFGYESDNVGTGFLMDRGYTYVTSGWMHRAARPGNPPALGAELPSATDDGDPITGLAMEEWIDPESGSFGRLSYPAATLDPTAATLTYRQLQDDPRQQLPATEWSYVDATTVTLTPPAGTDAGTIYEFVYEATDPVVMGLGFAAIRDLVAFARRTPTDDSGQANPLFEDGSRVLEHAIGIGSSQSGRVIRDFIYQGFNADPAGGRVFDGMTAYVAGARRTFVNARFGQPGRWTRQHEDHNYPMDEFPFSYATTTDPLTDQTDGLLALCSQSDTCPNVIQVDTESEWYGAHGSLNVTDATGQMVELPPNVRYWMLTTAHLQGNPGCLDPANPVAPFPYYRAAFDAMVTWVRDGVAPPPTETPSVDDGSAVTAVAQGDGYPSIPQHPFNSRISTLGVRDFSSLPPTEREQYPLFVPRLDEDGNATAGVVVPEVTAPVATVGKAIRAPSFAEGDLCSAFGSWLAFPRTKAEQTAHGDSRASLEERYPRGLDDYAERYAAAVDTLVAERFLLPDDGERLKKEAAAGTHTGF